MIMISFLFFAIPTASVLAGNRAEDIDAPLVSGRAGQERQAIDAKVGSVGDAVKAHMNTQLDAVQTAVSSVVREEVDAINETIRTGQAKTDTKMARMDTKLSDMQANFTGMLTQLLGLLAPGDEGVRGWPRALLFVAMGVYVTGLERWPSLCV